MRAHANDAASALRRNVGVQPAEYPAIAWSWKISDSLPGADSSRKDKDDCAARVMLLYGFEPEGSSLLERSKFAAGKALLGEEPPGTVLMYVWGETIPLDEPVEGPRSDRVRVIALRRSGARAGVWHDERRNHLEDYRWAFGREAPELLAVAILVDTDDTHVRATAWFRNLRLEKSTG